LRSGVSMLRAQAVRPLNRSASAALTARLCLLRC